VVWTNAGDLRCVLHVLHLHYVDLVQRTVPADENGAAAKTCGAQQRRKSNAPKISTRRRAAWHRLHRGVVHAALLSHGASENGITGTRA